MEDNETNQVPTASSICGEKTKHASLKRIKSMKNLICHTDLFESVTSFLIRVFQIEEMSIVVWLIVLVKHVI
jgi:hypothetical protein